MNHRKSVLYYLGTCFMFLGAGFLAFIYFPYFLLYITPPQQTIPHTDFSINIPKIHAMSPIIKNVDPWNEKEYLEALQKGVAQARGTVLPGQTGTIYLFAHSSDVPWHITRYNIAFFRLGELRIGDAIFIQYQKKQYEYKVVRMQTVSPNNISVLVSQNKNQLILQTCTPIGTSFLRLLVFASPLA